MANMSIADGDRDLMRSYTTELLERRKQLAPWPFSTEEEVTQLYMPPVIYKTLNELSRYEPMKTWLYHQRYVVVKVPHVIRGEYVSIRIHSRNNMPAFKEDNRPVIQSVEEWPRFHAWAKEAVRIELTNQLVWRTVNKTMNVTTTFKQLVKALPETMKAIGAHNDMKNASYHYRRASVKFREVMQELADDDGRRARSVPPSLQEILKDRRKVIETTMAQAVMLPNHNWIGDHPWSETWTHGLTLKT